MHDAELTVSQRLSVGFDRPRPQQYVCVWETERNWR